MDWRSIKFDWNRARAFLVTAEEGSLSAAARALGVAQPTLGRQVAALEAELDLILFDRVGRGLRLTQSGLGLLDHVRAMADAAIHVSLTATGQSQNLNGLVRIATSAVYAAFQLPPIIKKLREDQPGIELEIVTANTASDLLRREADIAIRNFRPTEPDLIARKIKDVPARFYASPQYLRRLGNPTTPVEFSQAEFINIDRSDTMMDMMNGLGFALSAKNFPILSENYLVMWEMVKQGIGIGVLDGRIGDAEPRVVRALPDLDPLLFPIWLVAHREVNASPRIRLVFDLLARELAKV